MPSESVYSTHLWKGNKVIGYRDEFLLLHMLNSKEHTLKSNIEKLNDSLTYYKAEAYSKTKLKNKFLITPCFLDQLH